MIGWLEILGVSAPISIGLVSVFVKMYSTNLLQNQRIEQLERKIEHNNNNSKQRDEITFAALEKIETRILEQLEKIWEKIDHANR